MTWGLVEGFVKWLLHQGYSLASVNNRLSAVKVYARLAAKAEVLPPDEHALIREVQGYGSTEGKRVNTGRPKTRLGHKKAEAIVLTAGQSRRLKTAHPPTPQGIRDRLLLCLLLDLGLRASEVAALRVEDLAEPGYVVVYRQKTDTVDRMALSADILQAMAAYEPYLRPQGILLRGSRKNEKLTEQTMSVRAIGQPRLRSQKFVDDMLGEGSLFPARMAVHHALANLQLLAAEVDDVVFRRVVPEGIKEFAADHVRGGAQLGIEGWVELQHISILSSIFDDKSWHDAVALG